MNRTSSDNGRRETNLLRSFGFRVSLYTFLALLATSFLFGTGGFILESRADLAKIDSCLTREGPDCTVIILSDRHSVLVPKGENAPELKEAAVRDILDSDTPLTVDSNGRFASTSLLLTPFSPFLHRDDLWRVMSISTTRNGEPDYRIVLAPLSEFIASRRSLAKIMWLMLLATTGLSIVFAGIIGIEARKPFARLKKAFSGVSISNMGLGNVQPGDSRETRELINTMNGILANLERSINQLQQFTSDASHELRTPLAIMKGQADIALLKERTPAYYEQKIKKMMTQIEIIQTLVGSLLELARLDIFDDRSSWESVDLPSLVRDAAKSAEPHIREKKQTLQKDLAATPVSGREALLLRMISNLLDNAVKYSPEGGTIGVRTWYDTSKKRSVIEISDNGPGMNSEQILQCFDRFWRAESARTSPGLGLGLPLVQRIADLHGATIEIDSFPGRGSAFRVVFPPAE